MSIKRYIAVPACLALAVSAGMTSCGSASHELREGDIVFSGSPAGQGRAIMNATGSPYTHCGIIFMQKGKPMVLEAVQPVGVVSFEQFKSRAVPGSFRIRRLKTALTTEKYRDARVWAEAQIGKDYDIRFLWGDDKLYCSELVWKIYQHGGVELCEPRRFTDYNLDDPVVKEVIAQRFGDAGQVPVDEKVVAPSDLAASTLLVDVPASTSVKTTVNP